MVLYNDTGIYDPRRIAALKVSGFEITAMEFSPEIGPHLYRSGARPPVRCQLTGKVLTRTKKRHVQCISCNQSPERAIEASNPGLDETEKFKQAVFHDNALALLGERNA